MSEIERHASENVTKLLVGNKSDLVEKRAVTFSEAKALADKYKICYLETSAKSAKNVIQSFEQLSRLIKSKVIQSPTKQPIGQNLSKISKGGSKSLTKESGCC